MHGGLSPELASMDQIRRIMRPTDVPDTGLLCDLLWSDPDKDIVGWGENDRGVSFTFGPDVVTAFLKRHDLDLICRAHQVVEDGYEFFSKRQLVTLFSAPNYCGCVWREGGGLRAAEGWDPETAAGWGLRLCGAGHCKRTRHTHCCRPARRLMGARLRGCTTRPVGWLIMRS